MTSIGKYILLELRILLWTSSSNLQEAEGEEIYPTVSILWSLKTPAAGKNVLVVITVKVKKTEIELVSDELKLLKLLLLLPTD